MGKKKKDKCMIVTYQVKDYLFIILDKEKHTVSAYISSNARMCNIEIMPYVPDEAIKPLELGLKFLSAMYSKCKVNSIIKRKTLYWPVYKHVELQDGSMSIYSYGSKDQDNISYISYIFAIKFKP